MNNLLPSKNIQNIINQYNIPFGLIFELQNEVLEILIARQEMYS
jgi:hypothetical protein